MGNDRARNGGIGLFVGREPALIVRDVGEEDGRMRIVCPIATERRMGDNGSFVR